MLTVIHSRPETPNVPKRGRVERLDFGGEMIEVSPSPLWPTIVGCADFRIVIVP